MQKKAVSSREIVYNFLLEQMQKGVLLPGSVLNLKEISTNLKLSSTPLRESLLKLEAEGFLTIYPRSKVVINSLTFDDFPFLYSVIGSIEFNLISIAIDKYPDDIIAQMRTLNEQMEEAIENDELMVYDSLHYKFHKIFVDLNSNSFAERILTPIKNRLWDFPRKNFIKEWYKRAVYEHQLIIDAIHAKDISRVEYTVKILHWGIQHNKDFIIKAYNL